MTSQLNVDTIVDKAGSGGTNVKIGNTSTYVSEGGAVTQNTVQGLTKEWCLFDQRGNVLGANTIGDSFNVGSVTDVSTGIIQMNFTNNMSGTSYSSIANGSYTGEIAQDRFSRFCAPAGLATSSYRQGAQYVNGTSEDVYWTLSTNGDLA